ncbi:hypothetical protein D6783_02975 [Candidatus Woesearchaeota archaeon]|nr:MAG: hypothetical protein D6783_02975 [Candidatus Woesearchaeota archaeon]
MTPSTPPPRQERPSRKEEPSKLREAAVKSAVGAQKVAIIGLQKAKDSKAGLFFLAWFLVFLADFFFQFERANQTSYAFLILYIILAFLAAALLEGSFLHTLPIAIALSLISWALPWIVSTYLIPLTPFSVLLLIIFPVWPLYLAFFTGDDSRITIWARRWFIFWAVIGIIISFQFVHIATPLTETIQSSHLPVFQAMTSLWDQVKGGVVTMIWGPVETGKQLPKKIVNFIEGYKRDVLLYQTEVDNPDKELPYAVKIETRLSGQEPITATQTTYIISQVTAATLHGNAYDIIPSCRSDTGISGDTYPSKITVHDRQSRSVRCTFSPGTFQPGLRRRATVSLTFPFRTEAIIPFVFMNLNIYSEFERYEGFEELFSEIKKPVVIQTPGPVNLAVKGDMQTLPVTIDPAHPEEFDRLISWELKPAMPQHSKGKVRSVTRMELEIPRPFTLKGCTPIQPDQVTPSEEATVYLWNKALLNERQAVTSVDCFLAINPEDEALSTLLTSDPGATRTFKISADYIFELSDQTTFRVIQA